MSPTSWTAFGRSPSRRRALKSAAGVIADGFLSKLSINRKFRTLALPVNVGARRDEIIAALGKPDDLPDNVFEYREEVSYANRSLETVRLHLTVMTIEWIYWLE